MTDETDVLASYRLWLLKMATVLLPGRRCDWHDLAQEGHIAMWRALRTYDPSRGALASWLTTAARMRMTDVVRRGVYTGMPHHRGRPRHVDIPTAELEPAGVSTLIEGVELAYHRGEILDALGRLSPQQREYVLLRFWGGATYGELVTRFGFNPGAIWHVARGRLRKQLAHLEEGL